MDPIFKPLLIDEEKIRRVVKKEFLKDNGDGTYDYLDGFNLYDFLLKSIKGFPKIRKVHKDFICFQNQLTTLEGGPAKVGGSFICSYNWLITLIGGPIIVGKDYYCHHNRLKSLEGGPKRVEHSFDCSYNQITSLVGGPKYVGWDFMCSQNRLKSLEGGPEWVKWDYDCSDNPLETLDGMAKRIERDFILLKCPKANDIEWLESELRRHAGIINGTIRTNQWRFRWYYGGQELRKF